jgi:hypothetical protein
MGLSIIFLRRLRWSPKRKIEGKFGKDFRTELKGYLGGI